MINFKRNFPIIVLLLLTGGALFYLNKQDNKSSPNLDISSLKKKIVPNPEVKDSISETSASAVSPPLPTPLVSSEDLGIHLTNFLKDLSITPVKNIDSEDLKEEIGEIQSFLEEEEVVKKLNTNQVSKEDREKLNVIFLRLQSLKEVRISRTLHDLEKDVNSYQKTHAERVKKFVQNKEESEDLNGN